MKEGRSSWKIKSKDEKVIRMKKEKLTTICDECVDAGINFIIGLFFSSMSC